MFTFIAVFICVFLIVLIIFNFQKNKSKNLYRGIIPLLAFLGWFIITAIYFDLSFNRGVGFVDTYYFNIGNKKAVTIGSGQEDGRNTYLTNRLAVESHLLLRLDRSDSDYIGTLELLTNKRKAIVNNKMLQNTSETENSIREDLELSARVKNFDVLSETPVENGDFIRIGYSNYKIYREGNQIVLSNVSLNFLSPTNIFYLYTTTTYPDVVVGEKQGVTTTSIGWLWLVTSIILFLVSYVLLRIVKKILEYKERDKSNALITHPLVYPVLYFSIFLEFLFLASLINFTIMYFYQFNHYEKGSLFTELAVFTMMFIFAFGLKKIYKKEKERSRWYPFGIIFGYFIVLFLIFIPKQGFVYSSVELLFLPKDMVIFFIEQLFLFSIFVLFFEFLSKDNNYYFQFKTNIQKVVYSRIFMGSAFLLFITLVAGASNFIHEGQGMVFIESAKIFTFLLMTILLHGSSRRHGWGYLLVIVVMMITLLMAIYTTKDKGSILQVLLVMGILMVLLKDGIQLKKRAVWLNLSIAFGFLAVVGFAGHYFYIHELQSNVRFAMWIEPFQQGIAPENQYFMYRYEQLARGLFMIKNSWLFSTDFVNNSFLPLPAIHTDFIFAFYTNIFGHLGVFALISSLFTLSRSFGKSATLYAHGDEAFKFLYTVNSIFIAYMLSYYIINIFSVLQIIPLTDVPLPFLTYSKGILVFFTMLYLFIVFFNLKYLELLTPKGK